MIIKHLGTAHHEIDTSKLISGKRSL